MFDSTMDHKDLIFQDATVRLVPVANLTYDQYLGENFVRLMQRINRLDAITGRNYVPRVTSNLLTIVLLIIVALLRWMHAFIFYKCWFLVYFLFLKNVKICFFNNWNIFNVFKENKLMILDWSQHHIEFWPFLCFNSFCTPKWLYFSHQK